MDFGYTEEQLRIKKGIREWAKEHLPEEVIAAGYKNRGIAPEVAKAIQAGACTACPRSTVERPATIRRWP